MAKFNLKQTTVLLLVLQALLMVCRLLFFPKYAPPWFWTLLAVTLGLIGILVAYCTFLRWQRCQGLNGLKKKPTLRGSITFHLGLVVVIIAGFYSTLFQYKALFFITEGQTLIDSPQNYVVLSQGPVQSADFGKMALTLLEVGVDFYDPNLIEHLWARVQVEDVQTGKVRQAETAMNRPFSYQSRKAAIYKLGFAPLVVIRSVEGELLWQGFVNLDLLGGKPDLFSWPLSGEQVRVEVSIDPNFQLTFILANAGGERIVLRPGEQPDRFLGSLVQIADYRYWLGFVVTNTRGEQLVLVGLCFAMVGIVLRYLFVFRDGGYRVTS